jgi:hypothetical protein
MEIREEVREGRRKERMEKLKNDNRTDKLIEYDGERIQQKDGKKIEMQKE